jgi:hypothetical protein
MVSLELILLLPVSFYIIYIDFILVLPVSEKGFDIAISITCKFSKRITLILSIKN